VNTPTNGTAQHSSRNDGSPDGKPAREKDGHRPEKDAHGQAKSPASGASPDLADRHRTGIPLGKLAIGLLVVLGIAALVLFPRLRHNKELKQSTEEMSVPTVTIMHPTVGAKEVTLTLPANVQAFYDAPIYARTNGYLKKWYVDIGAPVKQGQLLAEIETPEVDQQLLQARASRDQAVANLALSKTSADRWVGLLKSNAVSQQEVDERTGDLAARQADLAAAQANVGRLESMQSFQKLLAPFDGIVTARQTDVGALIDSSSAGRALFRVAQIGTLRVYVMVPEAYSASITPGMQAQVALASSPGQAPTGQVVSTAGSIDPTARTLLTEIQVPNPENKFMPGGYAQAHFDIILARPPLIVPANTLLFRTEGSQIGVVNSDHEIELKKVRIGRDFGTTVEITEGINPDDWIILNPSDSLTAGAKVNPQEKKADQPKVDQGTAPKPGEKNGK
jgi:RND family efflux transporter MFP subunit